MITCTNSKFHTSAYERESKEFAFIPGLKSEVFPLTYYKKAPCHGGFCCREPHAVTHPHMRGENAFVLLILLDSTHPHVRGENT